MVARLTAKESFVAICRYNDKNVTDMCIYIYIYICKINVIYQLSSSLRYRGRTEIVMEQRAENRTKEHSRFSLELLHTERDMTCIDRDQANDNSFADLRACLARESRTRPPKERNFHTKVSVSHTSTRVLDFCKTTCK